MMRVARLKKNSNKFDFFQIIQDIYWFSKTDQGGKLIPIKSNDFFKFEGIKRQLISLFSPRQMG